ncbi:MAG TPA: ABC transporter substrate-binding protein [Candidatus Kaiserbacteria bacterium]|nr:ABC transporter substrate-binding protein [Candidatus Kaiserbacteria bacterium]
MKELFARYTNAVTKHRSLKPLLWLTEHVRTIPSGDKLIVGVIGVAITISSIAGMFALERSFLVPVPAHGGILTEGEVGSPRFVNPLLAITDADRDVTALTYAGLMGLSGDGTLVPVLAKSYTVSPDGKTYTFVIRNNAKFSDGTNVTAKDVAFTVQKAEDSTLKSPQFANWNGITVDAINSHTVRFTLPKPYAPFLENTTLGILPAHLWRNVPDEQFPFTNLTIKPVGAGPFVVSNVVHDASGIITEYDLSASKNYVLGEPYLNGIHMRFYARESDLANALAGGEVESAYGIPFAGAKTAPFSSVFGVFFNADKNPVFTNLPVRKALSLAINRKYITDKVLHGYATELFGPVPPGSGVKIPTVTDKKDYLATAASVLEKAGWTYDGVARQWVQRRKKLTFSSITIKTSNVPELKAVASAVRNDWKKLGIDVSIELYEPGDLNQNVIRPRKYEALLFGMVIGRDQDLFAFWHSSQQKDPGLNIALYANKKVDALLEDERTNDNASDRLKDLDSIESDISADYPAAFTHTPKFIYALPNNIRGVKIPQITIPADRFATVAKWYKDIDYVWPFLAQNSTISK